MIPLDPPDACQSPDCYPGDSDALRPLSAETADGGILASYECRCGAAWQTRFDDLGWPVERTSAPVARPGRRAA